MPEQSGKQAGMLINGRWRGRQTGTTTKVIEVSAPYNGRVIGLIPEAGKRDVEDAVEAAATAFKNAGLSPCDRYDILLKTSRLIDEKKEEIARTLAEEAGKPIKEAPV